MKTQTKEKSIQSTNEPILLSAAQCAKICGVSRRIWFRLSASARTPASIRVGSSPLWRKIDIDEWIAMGCPDRIEFESRKEFTMQIEKAMATTSEAPKVMASHNNLNQNYPDSPALSNQKSLPEKLAAELTEICIYCQSPILCQAEFNQAFRLFESTLRKYLAVKNFDGWHGFSEPSSTDSGT